MDKIFQNSTARISKIENMKRDTEEINKNMYLIRVLKRETIKTGRGKIHKEKTEYISELMKDRNIQI